jgi:hypothetical protein
MKSILALILGVGAGYAAAQSLPDYVLTYGPSLVFYLSLSE